MIVISYSKRHFDPTNIDEIFGSAGQIARQVYLAARKISGADNVIYIDAKDAASWVKPSKLIECLITIEENALAAEKFYSPDKVLFIAVNHHPAVRRRVLIMAKELGISNTAIDVTDGIFESGQASAVAKKIMLVGDFNSVLTYLENGTKLRDIFPVGYKPFHHEWSENTHGEHILCHIGSIGFRKGADVIFALARHLKSIGSTRIIHLTGLPVNSYWSEELSKILEECAVNMVHHGWINPTDTSFLNLLNSSSVGIFPTREEGLSGAYLEIALSGIPVITTRNVGIETAPELTMESLDLKELIQILDYVAEAEPSDLNRIGEATRNLYNSMDNQSSQIYDAVIRYLESGRIWPKTNLVLAIHNKEKTLKKLFGLLGDAACMVDNLHLSVINDGSKDGSAKLIENFLRSKKTKKAFVEYEYLTTPDIFEVKSNNIGMKQFDTDYHIILQDDNFILNKALLAEMISVADKYRDLAALGGMAGVNFYPIVENCSNHFPGQHAVSSLEHYWRQDQFTNPTLFERYFEVDAVMRGPLLMSSKAIKEIGLLDERYAPLYSDDMAWCSKARDNGYRIMGLTGEVYNNSQTMTTSSELQNKIYLDAYQQNTKLFYQEWPPSDFKHYRIWARTIWRVPKSRSHSLVSLMKNPYSLNRKILSTYVYVNYPIISKGIRAILQSMRKLAP